MTGTLAEIDWISTRIEPMRDAGERIDIAARFPEIVAELQSRIESLDTSAKRYPLATGLPAPADEKRLERLRAFGYMGGKEDG